MAAGRQRAENAVAVLFSPLQLLFHPQLSKGVASPTIRESVQISPQIVELNRGDFLPVMALESADLCVQLLYSPCVRTWRQSEEGALMWLDVVIASAANEGGNKWLRREERLRVSLTR